MMHDPHVVMLAWTISHIIQLDISTAWDYFYSKQMMLQIGMERTTQRNIHI